MSRPPAKTDSPPSNQRTTRSSKRTSSSPYASDATKHLPLGLSPSATKTPLISQNEEMDWENVNKAASQPPAKPDDEEKDDDDNADEWKTNATDLANDNANRQLQFGNPIATTHNTTTKTTDNEDDTNDDDEDDEANDNDDDETGLHPVLQEHQAYSQHPLPSPEDTVPNSLGRHIVQHLRHHHFLTLSETCNMIPHWDPSPRTPTSSKLPFPPCAAPATLLPSCSLSSMPRHRASPSSTTSALSPFPTNLKWASSPSSTTASTRSRHPNSPSSMPRQCALPWTSPSPSTPTTKWKIYRPGAPSSPPLGKPRHSPAASSSCLPHDPVSSSAKTA
jgi:hypothetical protein